MANTTETRDEALGKMYQALGTIILEQMTRQTTMTWRQDLAIMNIADHLLELTKARQCDGDTRNDHQGGDLAIAKAS